MWNSMGWGVSHKEGCEPYSVSLSLSLLSSLSWALSLSSNVHIFSPSPHSRWNFLKWKMWKQVLVRGALVKRPCSWRSDVKHLGEVFVILMGYLHGNTAHRLQGFVRVWILRLSFSPSFPPVPTHLFNPPFFFILLLPWTLLFSLFCLSLSLFILPLASVFFYFFFQTLHAALIFHQSPFLWV